MPAYTDRVLDEIRAAADLAAVVSQSVRLKRVGKGFAGLCPFHKEKTPSFHVNPHKQFFKCYGCGEGGDVISFVRKTSGLGFREAVQQLARQFHVRIPDDSDPREEARTGERETLYRVNAWAAGHFQRNLLDAQPGNPGLPYLKSRGLTEESLAAFRLGWSPDSWDDCLKAGVSAGFSPELLEKAGLVLPGKEGRGPYDRFRGRVIFPIVDAQGRVIGFGGRVLGKEEPKYLNSPTTPVFSKGSALYGLDRAGASIRQEGRVAVMEGYTDVIRAHQAGLPWAVATLGTALTPDHATLLKRYSDQVVLVYDADAAGKKAADRGLDVFLQGNFLVRVCTLPEGEDPCDYFGHASSAEFAALAAGAGELVDYRISQARKAGRFATVKEQADVLKEILGTVAGIPDPAQRELMVKRVSELTGVTEASLWRQMRMAIPSGGVSELRSETPVKGPPASVPTAMEKALLGVLLQDPSVVRGHADLEGLRGLVLENPDLAEPFREAFLRGLVRSAAGPWDPQAFISSLEEDEEAKRWVVHAWDELVPESDGRQVWTDCLGRLEGTRLEVERRALRMQASDPEAFRRLVDLHRRAKGVGV